YSTDIRAFINGVEVPSYNIGGRTAIVVEDVLPHYYSNEMRALMVGSFAPSHIQGGRNVFAGKIGEVVGQIYETDILTYVYSETVPSWNIGGKTAIAIEDLGGDGIFNGFGGRYFWNAKERTISLEFLYENAMKLPEDAPYSIIVRIRDGNVRIAETSLEDSGSVVIESEWSVPDLDRIRPLLLNGEAIGWYVERDYMYVGEKDGVPAMRRGRVSFYQYDNEKIAESISTLDFEDPDIDDVIEFYRKRRLADPILSFAAKQWTFMYMRGPTPYGNTDYLLLIKPNGTWHDYAADFVSDNEWGTYTFTNLIIDRATAEVRFFYGDKPYVIDLATGVLRRG
ncbi:MAG: hypothetical protein J5449_10260, partial [Oscillospiraceae bacterium]|nr:hypothetical protein [Oscillospiraceae bacterium]